MPKPIASMVIPTKIYNILFSDLISSSEMKFAYSEGFVGSFFPFTL